MGRASLDIRGRSGRSLLVGLVVVLSALSTAGVLPGSADAAARARSHSATFRVSSFNVLGYGHTVRGARARKFADGRTRMSWAVRFLDRSKISIVGFQEFQAEQRQRFMKVTGHSWNHYPGDALNFTEMHNSIAWRTGTWKLLEKHTIKIPYFHGKPVRMPYLLMRHRASGRKVWFANFHNPADTRGNAERYRRHAMRREVALANRLRATGLPVIFTGDMNEREEYFCGMTRGAPMKAAQGGSYSTRSGCRPPTSPGRRPGIDWIFGSRWLEFSGYQRVDGGLVDKITDHPVIFVDVRVPARH